MTRVEQVDEVKILERKGLTLTALLRLQGPLLDSLMHHTDAIILQRLRQLISCLSAATACMWLQQCLG